MATIRARSNAFREEDEENEDGYTSDEGAAVAEAIKCAGDEDIDYPLSLWRRETERALILVLGRENSGNGIKLEQTLTSYTFYVPGFVDSWTFGLSWRLCGLRAKYDESLVATKFYIPKPIWIAPTLVRISWSVARVSWVICFGYLVWWMAWEIAR